MDNSGDDKPSQDDMKRVIAFTRDSKRLQKRKKKSSPPIAPINQGVTYLEEVSDPITYDYKIIEQFLNVVFHSECADDEFVCCYFDTFKQGFPLEEGAFFDKIEATREAAKLYFGTGTVSRDPERGVILNRNTRFVRYHVLVLDDIGTKVRADKLPAEFLPTYIIESSPDNFQYGYVLEEPITDFEQARALVELVYGAGFSDAGGKLVMKKVRLPEGINGKRTSPNREFRVKLHTMDGPLWSPERIIEVLGVSASWDTVVEDALEVRRRNAKVVGTSLWSPLCAQNASLDGVIDPILEWLVDNHMVVNFDHDWAEIKCPWHTEHTAGEGDTAYYAPVGHGDVQYQNRRAFNCYHTHGVINGTDDFLKHVAENGGPDCAAFDPAAALVASHVYDSVNNTIWGIKELFPRAYKGVDAFKNTFNSITRKPTLNLQNKAEFRPIALSALFMYNPARVVVNGTTFDPRTTSRIVREHGLLKLNTFSPPAWGEGSFDAAIVQPFIDFLEYLIPIKFEREIFIEWLAAKVQNMGFRGWGMMMVTKDKGTGRGTLALILTRLFDHRNCADRTFKELLNPSSAFNEWQAKLLIISNEASDTSDSKGFYDQYVQLREIIDTTPKHIEINNKYGAIETRLLCTSHLIFTNYENGAAIEADDRRIFVISNVQTPANAEYFTKIMSWANTVDDDGGFLFVNHVARWLKSIPVDLTKMNGRAPFTRAKQDMIDANTSALDVFMHTFISSLPTPFSHSNMVKQLSLKFHQRIGEPSDPLLKRIYEGLTDSVHAKNTFYTKGKSVRLRVSHKHDHPSYKELYTTIRLKHLTTAPKDRIIRRTVIDALELTDLNAIAKRIEQALDIAGY